MSLSKTITLGSIGSITISEGSGIASLAITVGAEAGGGAIAGFAKVKNTTEVDIEDQILVDAGLEIAATKFPGFAVEIAALKALIDSKLST